MKVKVKGKKLHNYRVVLENSYRKEIVVAAKTAEEAEDMAYNLAEAAKFVPEEWDSPDLEVRDCTSVEMTDGTWRYMNEIEAEELAEERNDDR